MDGTAAEARCRVKTGTLTGVSNLSGYCFNASGRDDDLLGPDGQGPATSTRPIRSRTGSRPRSPALSWAAAQQLQQAGFVEHLGAEFLAFASFEPGLSPATT